MPAGQTCSPATLDSFEHIWNNRVVGKSQKAKTKTKKSQSKTKDTGQPRRGQGDWRPAEDVWAGGAGWEVICQEESSSRRAGVAQQGARSEEPRRSTAMWAPQTPSPGLRPEAGSPAAWDQFSPGPEEPPEFICCTSCPGWMVLAHLRTNT